MPSDRIQEMIVHLDDVTCTPVYANWWRRLFRRPSSYIVTYHFRRAGSTMTETLIQDTRQARRAAHFAATARAKLCHLPKPAPPPQP